MKFRVSGIQIDEEKRRYTITASASDARVTAEFTLGSGKHGYFYRTYKERDKSLWELREEARTQVAAFCEKLATQLSATPR